MADTWYTVCISPLVLTWDASTTSYAVVVTSFQLFQHILLSKTSQKKSRQPPMRTRFMLKHTQYLVMDEAHYVHSFHGFLEVVFVLLAWNCDVTVGQETVVIESFQKQIRCGLKNGETFQTR